ncbi:MAG: hypothetical protein PHN44_00055 [Candidatus Marinimicrobia bacterium]|nr:hypothetical protein [Candidatus Neomarinimicrobiota bacterium]
MKYVLIIFFSALAVFAAMTDREADRIAQKSIAALQRIQVSEVKVLGDDRDTICWIENGRKKISIRRGGIWHFDGWKAPERKRK